MSESNNWNLEEIKQALGEILVSVRGNTGARLGPVCTDTRKLSQGSIFIALKGGRFDGHDYAAEAARNGAQCVIAEHETGASCTQIIVTDTVEALGALAHDWRRRFGIPVILVAGSNGKTTTTQMIASILNEAVGEGAFVATQSNFNNHIGVPQTLLRFTACTKAAVVEAGINHSGEMARLASWIRPTVAVLINAQLEHQEFLSGCEGSARENAFALVSLPAKGTAVLPAKDGMTGLWRDFVRARGSGLVTYCAGSVGEADVVVTRVGKGSQIVAGKDSALTRLAVRAGHFEHDAAAAAAASLAAGVSIKAVAQGLARFRPLSGRGERHLLASGALLIDDTYNANPDSMRAAIDLLSSLPGPRVLIAGDMAETGAKCAQFHTDVGNYAKKKGIDRLILTGPNMQHAALSFGPAARHYEALEMLLRASRETVCVPSSVLIKASRAQGLDRIVKSLLKDPGPAVARQVSER